MWRLIPYKIPLSLVRSNEIKGKREESGEEFSFVWMASWSSAVGITVLKTFGYVFKYRYEIAGITDLVQKASKGL